MERKELGAAMARIMQTPVLLSQSMHLTIDRTYSEIDKMKKHKDRKKVKLRFITMPVYSSLVFR